MKSSLKVKMKVVVHILALSVLMVFSQNCVKLASLDGESQEFLLETNLPSTDIDSIARGQRFEAAKEVLQRNCVSCHSSTGSMPTTSLTSNNESYFISANLIAPGKAAESRLLTKLRNYPTGGSARTMPPTGPL